jgi:hypothetical protein
MIAVGQPYRPAGMLDLRSILITAILGVTAAVIGAALVWLWEWSPIPTLLLVTPAVQGVGIGAVMAFAVGRLRMRNPRLVATVGVACGLLSVCLVHYGHYIHLATEIAGEVRSQIARDRSMPQAEREVLLARLDDDPAAFVDPLLVRETGHSGFLGSLILRNQQGIQIKSRRESGIVLWIIWGVEAIIAALGAMEIPTRRAAAPFCEDCGAWCEKQPDLFTLPAASAVPLIEAIRADDPARVAELRADPPPYDESGLVGVTLDTCPGCDQSFADASLRVSTGKKLKITGLLKQQRISPEMAKAMRTAPRDPEPREAVADDEPKGEVVDEPQPLS